MDTLNKYAVGFAPGDAGIYLMNPPCGKISKADALLLAAWLVAIADPLEEHFAEILKAVQNS